MRTPSRAGGLRSLPRVAAAAACVFGADACALEVPVGEDVPDYQRVADITATRRDAADVLFVVDDRASMANVRLESVLLWRRLREHLAYADGGFPDVHVGVVSADVGVGVTAKVDGCSPYGGDGALIAGADGSRWLDVDATNQQLSDPLVAARLDLADAGCPFDQPVAAMERALGGAQAANAGFRRPEAALAIVFVSGDDDCSAADDAFWADDGSGNPVDAYRCFHDAVYCPGDDVMIGERKGCTARTQPPHLIAPDQVHAFLDRIAPRDARFVTAIVGDESGTVDVVDDGGGLAVAPACDASARTLYPGVRLRDVAEGDHGAAVATCDASVETAGTPTGLGLRGTLGNACLGGAIFDTKPDEDGVQPDCVVDADAGGVVRSLPSCENPNLPFAEPGPCFAIEPDAAACGDYPSRLSLLVNWGGAMPHVQPADSIAHVRCVLASQPQ